LHGWIAARKNLYRYGSIARQTLLERGAAEIGNHSIGLSVDLADPDALFAAVAGPAGW
jgi:hypothetical protein